MELVTSVVGGEAPRDGAALSIALGLQGGNALAQVLHTCHATRQTASRKDTDLDLGHVQPTAMFGRVMELHALQDAPGLGWRVRLHTTQQPYACSGYPARGARIPPADSTESTSHRIQCA